MKQLLLLMFLLAPCLLFAQGKTDYVCPPCGPCDTLVFHQPGKCPHCGMKLIKKDTLQKRISVCFLLYDDIEILDFAGPLEVFADAGFKVFTVAKHKQPVISQGVLKVLPDYSIADAPPADILAVFGGNAGPTSEDPEIMAWIKARDKNTERYFSVCTGAFIIGNAGLLDNQTATTYHEKIDALRERFPRTKVLENVRYVDNGRVITTAGISAGIDGALHLVAKLKGEEEALRVARVMEYDKYVPNQGLTIR
ncbi:DJ-1/PfpI family protein [Chitinophaga oryzae]|uniref:DJ-1/PfpI family protein n=1 Tax=Chitinophaga oryzae TaxID=2725414 RepID=A0AAE6ZJA6_9BACT|nr:DJ-1/PfpI family protein [Chitinophaga oryzae]QJB32434.1 DJ-1/PfpI family protein [Chitinophaga oryzae]QJB38906.1 DJ-1/PfpI family protein [Chitinophaga oryzae]